MNWRKWTGRIRRWLRGGCRHSTQSMYIDGRGRLRCEDCEEAG